MMATVFNALHGTNDYGDDITYRMNGALSVKGYPDVALKNMFAPLDSGQPAAALAAATIGDRFGRIYDNPYDAPDIQGVKLDFDLVRERRSARLEASRTDVTEAPARRSDHGRDRASSVSRGTAGPADSDQDSHFGVEGNVAHSGQ